MPSRYCAVRFACRVPTWRLPAAGSVADLLTEGGVGAGIVHDASCAPASNSLGALGGDIGGGESGLSRRGCKRVRLSRKTQVSEAFLGVLKDQPRLRLEEVET